MNYHVKKLKDILVILLATAGIRVDRITPGRLLSIGGIILVFIFHRLIAEHFRFQAILLYFGGLFAIRYVFLFGGFCKRGFCALLKSKFGEENGWSIYELITSILFFQRGLCFGLLANATNGTMDTLSRALTGTANGYIEGIVHGLGVVLVIAGLWINITASLVIGIDTYFYKDLFLKRPVCEFKRQGPYKYFHNPMYGIGQVSGYGAALMVGSLPGLLATLLNQVIMYLFYYSIEKPHLQTLYMHAVAPTEVKEDRSKE